MSNLANTIKKDRYFLEIEKKSWIIDCFKENIKDEWFLWLDTFESC